MSKQTRKKSSKPGPLKAVATKPRTPAKAAAGKSASKLAAKLNKTPAKASHKPPSKALKESTVGKSRVKPRASAGRKSPVRTAAALGKSSAERVPGTEPGPRTTLTEGSKAPGFALPRDGGESVTLASYSGKKLAIFFYPRAGTPGCTREAIDFNRLATDFAACGTDVIGVSADSIKAQESFRNKHDLTIPLISDEQHEMLEAYGAWGEKSMYGRTFQGVIRTTVLVGADGRVVRIWRGVKVDGHADEVLAVARTA